MEVRPEDAVDMDDEATNEDDTENGTDTDSIADSDACTESKKSKKKKKVPPVAIASVRASYSPFVPEYLCCNTQSARFLPSGDALSAASSMDAASQHSNSQIECSGLVLLHSTSQY